MREADASAAATFFAVLSGFLGRSTQKPNPHSESFLESKSTSSRDGALDLSDETLAQMDVVIASVHSLFNQPLEEMTARVLRAIENPHVKILGHPTGRKLLGREGYQIDMGRILKAAAAAGVAVEHNANPNRLDLSDLHLRMAKEAGCKIVVNTDAHHTSEFDNMRYGMRQLRRAWLTNEDVLNTLSAKGFLTNLRPSPN